MPSRNLIAFRERVIGVRRRLLIHIESFAVIIYSEFHFTIPFFYLWLCIYASAEYIWSCASLYMNQRDGLVYIQQER